LQEINERAKRFPSEINTDNVDEIVFVAEHVRKIAVDMYDWHDTSTTTIQNHVDVNRHIGDKIGSAGKTLGLVGIIPMRKRLDRALDLVKILRKKDPEWKLIVKGRKPGDISFMHSPSRKAELEYYETQYRRVDVDPDLKNAVTFEGYTMTIASWYQKIGFVLSPSDFESFHFSVGDGVSSGAVPVIWPWEGADVIYPSSWVIEDTEQAAIRIMEYASGGGTNPQEERNRDYIAENYGCDVIFMKLRMALGLE
jgi:glycosyltransferase involved in cell wall biosynthesis